MSSLQSNPATDTLSWREWRGLLELANARKDFEPLAMRAGVGPVVAERLVAKGLAEMGPSAPRFNREAFPVGYRLTDLGRDFLERGREPNLRK
jgi:hypothetical protein